MKEPRVDRRAQGRRRVSWLWPRIVMALGVLFLVWPVATQWCESWQASREIRAATYTYDMMGNAECEILRTKAEQYNEAIAAGRDLSALDSYDCQLSYRGSKVIAYISIPKCAIRLPIYHGTDESVLEAGVGHLEGTSLPIGGRSTHCVLTAHTGMEDKRIFDDIRLLGPGDEFSIWTLGEYVAYRVTDAEIVLPADTSSLGIVEGEDLCTLVTCTPYGVNTHRLLVHARRCVYREDLNVADAAVYVNDRTLPLILALCVLVVFLLLLMRRV